MSESTTSALLEPLALFAHGARRVPWVLLFSWTRSVLAVPVKAVVVPVRLAAALLLVALAPLLHVLSYGLACLGLVLALLVGLEPLYIFFGVAAILGVSTGLITAVFSNVVTSSMGMRNEKPSPGRHQAGKSYRTESSNPYDESSPSSTEPDWQWPSEPMPSRRRPASGLLSQIIHEEDDDDSAS